MYFSYKSCLLLPVLLVCCAAAGGGSTDNSGGDVALRVPVFFDAPVGRNGESEKLELMLPTKGEYAVSDPQTLFDHCSSAWDALVETNKAGLVDPKQQGTSFEAAPLTESEAWHHWQASQSGVVDSGRFLVTFGVMASLKSGGSPLHIAASLGQAERVIELLEDENMNLDVDARKKLDGTTALHAASSVGHANVVRVLLDFGANVEAVGNSGVTPLQLASTMGHIEVMNALLDGGASINAAHKFGGTTALHFAAEMGRVEAIKLLCTRGANVEAKKTTGGTALHTASDTNQSLAVRALIDNPCNGNVEALLMGDSTPLYMAAQRGFHQVCEVLLDHGKANPNFIMPTTRFGGHLARSGGGSGGTGGFYEAKNTEIGNGATALHSAVENGHPKTVQTLLSYGALQYPSMEGASPLVIAIQYRHPEIAKILLQNGNPHINAQVPKDGAFALFVAAGAGYADVVDMILERKDVDLDLKNNQGLGALSYAAARRHFGIVKSLLHAGIKLGENVMSAIIGTGVDIGLLEQLLDIYFHSEGQGNEENDGVTLLHTACSSRRSSVVKLLVDRYAVDVNARVISTGASPLMMASKSGDLKSVEILLKNGAIVTMRANREKLHSATALYLAAQSSHLDVAKALIHAGAVVDARLYQIGVTPLFIASERGNLELVDLFLKHGANVHVRNWNGITPFAMAAISNNLKVMEMLRAAGAHVDTKDNDGNSPLLNWALQGEKFETLEKLVQLGAKVCIKRKGDGLSVVSGLVQRFSNGRRKTLVLAEKALALLVKKECVKRMLDSEMNGESPLHVLANTAGSEGLIELFLKNGANVNTQRSFDKATALHISVLNKHVKLTKVLLQYGADANTMMHVFSDRAKAKSRLVEFYLSHQPEKVKTVDSILDKYETKGYEKLFKALAKKYPESIVPDLTTCKVSVSEATKESSIDIAKRLRHFEILKLLTSNTVDVFSNLDFNGDGVVKRADLVKGMKSNGGNGILNEILGLPSNSDDDELREKIELFFSKYDLNNDRVVSRNEYSYDS